MKLTSWFFSIAVCVFSVASGGSDVWAREIHVAKTGSDSATGIVVTKPDRSSMKSFLPSNSALRSEALLASQSKVHRTNGTVHPAKGLSENSILWTARQCSLPKDERIPRRYYTSADAR